MAAQESSSCKVLESWEDFDEKQIIQKLPDLNRTTTMAGKISKCNSNSRQQQAVVIVDGDDKYRTQFTAPEPSVKILKRPSREERLNGLSYNGNNGRTNLPPKSLKQREAEYAEARLRILGQAKSPEDELDERLSRLLESSDSAQTLKVQSSSSAQVKILRGGANNNSSSPPPSTMTTTAAKR